MNSQTVLLVNEKDKFLGHAPKMECHTGRGRRHRAFVTLLFDSNDNVILQKRKHRLFDGLSDLTAISHPLHIDGHNESYQAASDRALKKEMGIGHVVVKKVGGFNYFAQDGANCENEFCAILVGNYDGEFKPNKKEVYEAKKTKFSEFLRDVSVNPQKYTPWARLAAKKLKSKVKV
ncbi:NUDIX domain-containing protein [Candidatus Curtissbacteria bacterium]|nr:NUDIX domain-containing protein [Candidatus Curtissbacteria bacterium]